MNKENAVRKNIHLYKENVEQLKFLSKHSFTNDSQYIRRLIAKDYQNVKNQIDNFSHSTLQNI
jgi:predicted DNA-binding protein